MRAHRLKTRTALPRHKSKTGAEPVTQERKGDKEEDGRTRTLRRRRRNRDKRETEARKGTKKLKMR
jgi:hypothetical protein